MECVWDKSYVAMIWVHENLIICVKNLKYGMCGFFHPTAFTRVNIMINIEKDGGSSI